MKNLAEKTVSFLMLFYATHALFPQLFPPGPTLSFVVGVTFQVVVYGAAFVFILLRWKQCLLALRSEPALGMLVFLAILSSAWSQYHTFSLRRSLILAATTLFGIYFGTRFTRIEQFRILAFTFGAVQLLSIVFVIFLPAYGLDHGRHGGAWQGVFHQKNELGRMMALSALVFLLSREALPRTIRWIGLIVSLGLLFQSHSVTGVAVLALTIGCLPVIWVIRRKFTFAAAVFIFSLVASAILGSVLINNRAEILALMHRNENLTGRTLIWTAVIPEIAARPLLGYGYSAFWLRTTGASANVVEAVHFMPVHSHNGFLDLLLELGGIGLAIFLMSYISQIRDALRAVRHSLSAFDEFALLFLLMTFFYNLAESPLVRENHIHWVLYATNAVNLLWVRSPKRVPSEAPVDHGLLPLGDYLQRRPSVGF